MLPVTTLGSEGVTGVITVSELNDNPRPITSESPMDRSATSMLPKSLSEPSSDQRSCGMGGRVAMDDAGAGGYPIGQMQSMYDGGPSRAEMDSQGDW